MAERDQPTFWRRGNPIMWACVATVGFAALIISFGLTPTCNEDLFPNGDCPAKWRHLYAAPPNEVGDSLAGLAGVLAFIWLIATVLLQSVELGAQRRVLALQKEEMEEQRKATQDMATAAAEQAGVASEQVRYLRLQNEREHQRLSAEQFDSLVTQIDEVLKSSVWKRTKWLVEEFDGQQTIVTELNLDISDRIVKDKTARPIEGLYPKLLQIAVYGFGASFPNSELPVRHSKFSRLLAALKTINELQSDLPPDRLADFRAWRLDRAFVFLEELNEDKYWAEVSRRKSAP